MDRLGNAYQHRSGVLAARVHFSNNTFEDVEIPNPQLAATNIGNVGRSWYELKRASIPKSKSQVKIDGLAPSTKDGTISALPRADYGQCPHLTITGKVSPQQMNMTSLLISTLSKKKGRSLTLTILNILTKTLGLMLERGHMLESPLEFPASKSASLKYEELVGTILFEESLADRVEELSIMDTLKGILDVKVEVDVYALSTLFQRYYEGQGVFVTSCKFLGVTLEDVAITLHLPVNETHSLDLSVPVNGEAQEIIILLRQALSRTTQRKRNLTSWVEHSINRYSPRAFEPMIGNFDHVLQLPPAGQDDSLATKLCSINFQLLCMVMPSEELNGPNANQIELTIRLARSEQMALAPLVLGMMLYKLDQFGL